ncbi:MAG: MmcQ/YjbR family DNA-binding protein [Myxococcota bacterium]
MPTWEDVLRIADSIPEVEVSTWFRAPALRVAKKGFVRLRADGGLFVLCDHDEKQALLAREDPAFYVVPGYEADAAILVNLEAVDLRTLTLLVTRAWTLKAPQRLRKQVPEFERTEPRAEPPPADPPKKRAPRRPRKKKAEDAE